MIKSVFFGLILFFSIGIVVTGQELQCSVSVVSKGVQGTNKSTYENMQNAIREFMNNQIWTDNVFSTEERIQCSILINITKAISATEFQGTIQVQARRPVYNSGYNTTLLNYLDQDFQFEYEAFQPLEYNPTNIGSNLISVLAFYANIILALDYDSFSKYGGTKYFEQAEKIVSMNQNSDVEGWKSYESKRNRYWMTENFLNAQHRPLREPFYLYHRQGLDYMSEDATKGRREIVTALEKLPKVYRQRAATFAMQLFFDAKSDEIINIFSEGFPTEKKRVLEVLTEVDPSNGSAYKEKLSVDNE